MPLPRGGAHSTELNYEWVDPTDITVNNPVATAGQNNNANVLMNVTTGTYYATYSNSASKSVENTGNVWITGSGKQLSGVFVTGEGAKGTNKGSIYINGGNKDNIKGIKVNVGGTGINEGLIYVKKGAAMYDQRDGDPVTMINAQDGTIVTDGSLAYGIVYNGWNTNTIRNDGTIIAKNGSKGVYLANTFREEGDFQKSDGYGKQFSNTGLIQVEGKSTGIYSSVQDNKITNDGTISTLTDDAIGVNLTSGKNQSFTNNNTMNGVGIAIKSQIAGSTIVNKGSITSDSAVAIVLSKTNQTLLNSGLISGKEGAIDASTSKGFKLNLEGNSQIVGSVILASDAQLNVSNLTSKTEVLDLQNNELASVSIENAEIGFAGEGALSIASLSALDDNTAIRLTGKRSISVENAKGAVTIESDHLAESGALVTINKAEDKVAVGFTSAVTDSLSKDQVNAEAIQHLVDQQLKVEGAETTATFDAGLKNGEIVVDENGVSIKTNTLHEDTLEITSKLPTAMTRMLANDVRKRLGDIRSAQGTHGAWARYDGGKLSGLNDMESDFNTVQIGIDTVPTIDSARMGVAFSYTKGESSFDRGESDMNAFSLAAYGTKMFDNGMFIDVIGRMATVNNDLAVRNNGEVFNGETDNVALSLSGEMGWRLPVTEMMYVEPLAELTYTYINADKFTLDTKTFEVDSTTSLIGRVGFAAGFNCPSNFGNVYLRASAVHEFMGDSEVAVEDVTTKLDGKDTWFEYGIGTNINVSKNAYVWADVERTGSATLDEDWRATVGVRYTW